MAKAHYRKSKSKSKKSKHSLQVKRHKKLILTKLPIPFKEYKAPELDKSNSIEFEVRTDPNDDDSQTYKMRIETFEKGKPKHYLEHYKAQDKIMLGAGITGAPDQLHFLKSTYSGTALREFNTAIAKVLLE